MCLKGVIYNNLTNHFIIKCLTRLDFSFEIFLIKFTPHLSQMSVSYVALVHDYRSCGTCLRENHLLHLLLRRSQQYNVVIDALFHIHPQGNIKLKLIFFLC